MRERRACWIATCSAAKLEQCAPAEKESEKVESQEEQWMVTPAPPGPREDGTEPSVQTLMSAGGRAEIVEFAERRRVGRGSVREQDGEVVREME